MFMWGTAWSVEMCKIWVCHGGVTRDSVCILILHSVPEQIVPMFQKIIVLLKHCALSDKA
jgi:hypothetical protein